MRMIKKLASIALAATMIVSAASFTASANKLQPGDVNVDGKVDVTDATLVQLYVSNDQKTVESFIEGKYDEAEAILNKTIAERIARMYRPDYGYTTDAIERRLGYIFEEYEPYYKKMGRSM